MKVLNPHFFGSGVPFMPGPLPVALVGRPAHQIRPAMGQQQSEELLRATAEVGKIEAIADRISGAYNKLIQATSVEDANRIFEQAVESLEKAEKAYQELQG